MRFYMKKNMSSANRFFRLIISIGAAVLIFISIVSRTATWILGFIGVVFFLTAVQASARSTHYSTCLPKRTRKDKEKPR